MSAQPCNIVRLEHMFDTVVENCEITPIMRAETADGAPLRIGPDSNQVRFRWFRCEYTTTSDAHLHRMCSVPNCGKPASLQCVFCRVRERLVPFSYFCSPDCFQFQWREHRQTHDGTVPANLKVPRGAADIVSHWKEVSNAMEYLPGRHDVGRVLKLEVTPVNPVSGITGKPVVLELPEVLPALQPPPERRWMSLQTSDDIRRPKLTFRCLSYNSLADLYSTREVFPYCPPWALLWNYRKRLIVRELLSHNAEIIALQEVQGDHYRRFLEPEMRRAGYEGVYKQKTRESMGEEGKMDGCAIFYRTDRFALEEKHALEFNHVAMSRSKTMKNPSAVQCLLKDNVALVVVLALLSNGVVAGRICVATTHIFCNTDFNNVKMWQVHTLVRELEKFAIPRGLPLVIAGDFNATPQSAIYHFLSRAEVPHSHPELEGDEAGILETVDLRHQLELRDAYASLGGSFATNFTGNFAGILDYIWYTADKLQVLQVLGPVDLTTLTQHTALPSPIFASDHVPIVAEIEMLPHR